MSEATRNPAEGVPEAYRTPEVQAAKQTLSGHVEEMHRQGSHHLLLDDREFMSIYQAVEHDRSAIRKAVGKGLAHISHLRASDTLWQKLQTIMTFRNYRRTTL